MKPTFALNLTESGLSLLHRTPKGWLSVGETSFDSPDLGEALEYLRRTAQGLAPKGMTTKVVIPNSQILYLDVTAPGPDDESRGAQIRAALEGRTPYDVDDLAFDWSGSGPQVRVAVVARETLAEAEGFAVEHRFNPVSFVAIPEDGLFGAEPFFGEATHASTLLSGNERVERDAEPVALLTRAAAPEAPPAPEPAPEPEPEPEPLPEPEPEPAPAPQPEWTPPADPLPAAEPDPLPADLPEVAPPAPVEIPPVEIPPTAAATAADLPPTGRVAIPQDLPPLFADLPDALAPQPQPAPITARGTDPEPDVAAGNAAQDAPADADEAPFTHVSDTGAFPEVADAPEPAPRDRLTPAPRVQEPAPAPSVIEDPDVADDLPPAPPSQIRMAFASRRAGEGSTAPAVGAATAGTAGKGAPTVPPPARPAPSTARPPVKNGPAKGLGALVTAPSIPGTRRKKTAATPAPAPAPAEAPVARTPAQQLAPSKPLVKPGGTFGARPAVRGKPRHLGLILTGLLLIFLALVAAWSSFYLASSGTEDPETAIAAAEVPDVTDEMLADAQDPALLGAEEEAAPEALAGDVTAPAAEDTDALPDPAETAATEAAEGQPTPDQPAEGPAETVLAEPAPASAPADAATGPAALPAASAQDEFFLATADVPPPALDALALPRPEAVADPPPGQQMPPPAFGTVYAFDENGLVKPTPEGILSPEGVMLVAGQPPLLPPSRSAAVAEAAAAARAAQAAVVPAPAGEVQPLVPGLPGATDAPGATAEAALAQPAVQPNPELEDFRPRPRPEGLAPQDADDAAAPTDPATDFASPRPRARPPTVLAAGEEARRQTAAASLAAQAEAQAQAEAAASNSEANPMLVAISRRPAERPRDLTRAVEAAVAAAVRTPEPRVEPEPEPEQVAAAPAPKRSAPADPEEEDEPEVEQTKPSVALKGTVAKQATFRKALNLSKINLIGVYGTESRRYALIRQGNGRYKKVNVGDSIDGGKVAAITASEVRYQKGGRMLTLKMPKG